MTTPTPEALALATAARLAHANRERWATCDSGIVGDGDEYLTCVLCKGHEGRHESEEGAVIWGPDRDAVPLSPTLAAAKAEWAAAGGDPERGPALSGRSADGRVEWSVDWSDACACDVVSVRVGSVRLSRGLSERRWYADDHPHAVMHGEIADWRECVRLAEAADGGAR